MHTSNQHPPPPDVDPGPGGFRATLDTRILAVGIIALGAVLMASYHMVWADGNAWALIHGDERRYYLPGGLAILDDGLSWFTTDRSLWTGPITPLWVAAFNAHVPIVKAANVALFALAGAAAWDMARRLFGPIAALVTVALFAFYIPFYRFLPTLLTEPIFIFSIAAALWLIVVTDLATPWAAAGTGAVLGLATLTRVTLQAFPVFLLLSWLVLVGIFQLARRSEQSSSAARWISGRLEWIRGVSGTSLLLLILGFSVVVVPYLVKNIVALDRLALANGSGAVLYIGNDLRTRGDEPAYSQMTFDTGAITAPFTHLDTEGDRRLTEAAIERITSDPVEIALLVPQKAIRSLLGSKDHYFYPQSDIVSLVRHESWFKQLRIFDMVITLISVVCGMIGLFVLRLPPVTRLVMGSLIVYFVGIHAVLFPIPRLVMPIIPILMILAGGLIIRGRRTARFAALVGVVAVAAFISFQGVFESPGVSERYVQYFDEVEVAEIPQDVIATNDAVPGDDGWYRVTGEDPYQIVAVEPLVGQRNQQVFVRLAVTGSGDGDASRTAQLFWRSASGPFSEGQSVPFEIRTDGRERVYQVSPSFFKPDQWNGSTVAEIRIDLPGDAGPARFLLTDLEVRQ